MEQGRGREWFGIDDIIDNDVNVTSATNGIDSLEQAGDVKDTTVGKRLQESPTSSIENDPTVIPKKSIPNGGPPPSRKNVLAAAGAFEALNKEPAAQLNKSKVIFTRSRSLNTNHSENKTPMDEERRMRILGLSNADNAASDGTPNHERLA